MQERLGLTELGAEVGFGSQPLLLHVRHGHELVLAHLLLQRDHQGIQLDQRCLCNECMMHAVGRVPAVLGTGGPPPALMLSPGRCWQHGPHHLWGTCYSHSAARQNPARRNDLVPHVDRRPAARPRLPRAPYCLREHGLAASPTAGCRHSSSRAAPPRAGLCLVTCYCTACGSLQSTFAEFCRRGTAHRAAIETAAVRPATHTPCQFGNAHARTVVPTRRRLQHAD